MDKEPDQRDYGTLVHAIIEEFNNIYPGDIPENMQDILLELGKKHFQTMQLSKELEAFGGQNLKNCRMDCCYRKGISRTSQKSQ